MQTWQIDADFPGGNIILEGVDGDRARVRPDLRDTEGNWFYWCFRVRGAAGRKLVFEFTRQDPVGVLGPAVSLDEGLTWRWLGNPSGRTNVFEYAFDVGADSVRFSFGTNYLDRHWQRFCGRLAGHAAVREEILCLSRKGRPVPRLHVGCLTGGPRQRVLLTARHHCCEMMASYALEGFVDAVLAEDETGRWYRAGVEAVVLPFMDCDGVEDGDQGKNRRPRDHNRDYEGDGIYLETRALRFFVPAWSDGRLTLTADLHCPWIRGPWNEHIYQVGARDPAIWAEQQRLGAAIQRAATGSLLYRAAGDLPFGAEWNTGPGCDGGMSSSRWLSRQSGVRVATSIELPYANCSGRAVTADTARAFGRDLAAGVREYLSA